MSNFKSLDRAVDVLFSFSKENQLLSADEIAINIGLPRGSIYRYINALIENGLLEKSENTAKFQLGYKLLYFQTVIHYHDSLEKISYPYMEKLAENSAETVQLTITKNNHSVAIKGIEASDPVRVAPPIGQPGPLHAGANNKVIIAFRDVNEWSRVCANGLERITDSTIVDCAKFYEELYKIRKQGYAYSIEEMHMGAWGVAAPIFDSKGYAIASLGVSGPLFRNSETLRALTIKLVVEYCNEISARLQFDPSL